MTAVVEATPVEAAEQPEHLPGHDLSTLGLDAPEAIPVLAMPWQIAQKLHAVSEPPLRPGAENARYWDLIDLQLLQALTVENLAPVKTVWVVSTWSGGRDCRHPAHEYAGTGLEGGPPADTLSHGRCRHAER
jgi:hypothetical protein